LNRRPMISTILKLTRALIIGSLLVCAHAAQVSAADPPPQPAGPTMSDHLKTAAAAVKHSAKTVGSAVKQGAQKVGVVAKETAHTVADASKKGAREVGTAAKGVAEKTKAAVKGGKSDQSASKPSK